jgi:hypothetical protein
MITASPPTARGGDGAMFYVDLEQSGLAGPSRPAR